MNTPITIPEVRNITVSGHAASGATTLSKALGEKLGWQVINGGEIYREYARKNGIPLEQTGQSSDEYHLQLDNFIKEKLKKEKNLIVESWLSGFDAKNIEGVFKIFVTCSDDSLRAKRIVKRDKMSLEKAIIHLKTREGENLKKWDKLYHSREFWNPKIYNIVIDTYKTNPTETLNLALVALGVTG
ncbi:cytidylate kinase family protein [Patescibacteria group bacterium]|nr:cytidylate kinase family protein [Patescibacteria group bacterium]